MADALRLLFELDADGEPSVKEFKRVSTAFATELATMKKLAASAVKLSLVESRAPAGPNDGAAASKATLDSQREVNRQLEAMWGTREKEQAASLKKQSDTDRAFAAQQLSTVRSVEDEIAKAYKDRESQLSKTAKQSEDAWAKHEAAKLSTTRQAEKEGEATVAAASAAKDKAAKLASDNFVKLQKQTAAVVAKANAQTAANEIRAALVAAKGTADVSSVAAKGLVALGDHLNLFIGHRIPLAGGAFIRLSENLRTLIADGGKVEGSVLRLGNTIAAIANKTGKSTAEIQGFLVAFSKLGTQAEKDEAAVKTFGPALAQSLIPQLSAASTEMSLLAESTAEVGGGFAAMAGPIGIAVAVVAAVAVATGLAVKSMFDLAKSSAEVEGKFLDLNQQLGISAETLSALDVLISTTGGDLGGISAALGIFQKHLEDAEDPMSKSAGLFGEIGVNSKDTETALRQTFTALARMPEGFKQTALALELFGRSGKSVLAIIKETNGDLDAAIKRFRDLGLVISTEDAKKADEFNDSLELLNREVEALGRELGREFLPAALDIVHALSDLTKSSKGLFDLIGLVGKPVIDGFAKSMTALSIAIALANHNLPEAIRRFKEFDDERRKIEKPIEVPDIKPVALPTGEEGALKKAREDARLVRFEVTEAVRFAESQISAIDRQLQLREISPTQALEPIIATEKAKTEAVIKGLEAQREARGKEFIKDEVDRQKMADDIQAIDQQIANEQSRLQKFEADKRAEFRAQEIQREQAHRRALADLFVSALNDRIAAVNRTAQTGTNTELFAQDVTTELLRAGFEKRREVLEKERTEAGKDPALTQQINSQLADLQRERTATLAERSDQRIAIVRNEQSKQLDLQRQTIDSLLRTGEIVDNSRIAAIKALADLRVRTEESAARAILKIRLDALDREEGVLRAERDLIDRQIQQRLDQFSKERKALEAERDKAGAIADPTLRNKERNRLASELQANVDAELDAQKKANKDREEADTDLNNKLRVLGAQRSQIQFDGNRDVDKGRQDDLDNARKHANDLKEIQRDIADIEQDTVREVIELMRLHFARGKDIIRAQRDLELRQDDERHRRVTDSIRIQQSEVDEQIRILESHLKSLRHGTDEEIAEHERLVAELERLRLKRAQLKAQQEAEDQRSETRRRRVTDQSDQEEERADPLGRLGLDTENLQDFADTIEQSIVPLGQLLTDTFLQVADAIGQTVENWVLLGETGPAVMRKILAQALASLAKEATVNAIKELALGFATLFFNPAESTAHFTAAALWASIAGVSGLLGRKVAGDLFKQKDTADRASRGGGAVDENQPNNRNFSGLKEPTESSEEATRDGSAARPRGLAGAIMSMVDKVEQQVLEAQRQQQLNFAQQQEINRQQQIHNGLVAQALPQIAQTFSHLGTARRGDVVTVGLQERPDAVEVAVIERTGANHGFKEELQRNLGLV